MSHKESRQSEASGSLTALSALGSDVPSSDVASVVFSFAEKWVYAQRWYTRRHPESGPLSQQASQSSWIEFSSVLSAEDMLQLYRDRQLKGSNLIVGLTPEASDKLISVQQDIPPSYFRTLAYLFEVAKSHGTYTALTSADLARGTPDANWARPLWTITESVAPSQEADVAARLFQAAPYWCYLYSHELQRAKKTPPKTSAQMLEMYRAGCLPAWTPVLGLEEDVAKFNSLPPSLFMPLSSLCCLLSSGMSVKAVGLPELQRYDKFIDTRTPNGNTQGMLMGQPCSQSSGTSANSSMQVPPTAPPPAVPPPIRVPPPSSLSAPSAVPAPGTPGFAAAGFFQPCIQPGAGGMFPHPVMMQSVWGFGPGFNQMMPPPGSGFGYGSASRAAATAPASPAASAPRQGMAEPGLSPWGSGPGGWTPGSQGPAGPHGAGGTPASGKRMHRASSGATVRQPPSPAHGQGCPSPMMPAMVPVMPQGPPPIRWHTALFKLFTADMSRGMFEPAWWYQDASVTGGVVGPIAAEHMILSYARGMITDAYMVCGTTSDVPPTLPPPRDNFEAMGTLLQKVEQGGHYVLVTLNEILERSYNTSAGTSTAPTGPTPSAADTAFWNPHSSSFNVVSASAFTNTFKSPKLGRPSKEMHGSSGGRDVPRAGPRITVRSDAAAVVMAAASAMAAKQSEFGTSLEAHLPRDQLQKTSRGGAVDSRLTSASDVDDIKGAVARSDRSDKSSSQGGAASTSPIRQSGSF